MPKAVGIFLIKDVTHSSVLQIKFILKNSFIFGNKRKLHDFWSKFMGYFNFCEKKGNC